MKKQGIISRIGSLGVLVTAFLFAGRVSAGVVEPSGEKYADGYAIQEELYASKSVTLVPGATYYLHNVLRIKSGCSIDATGATLIWSKSAKGGTIRNEPSPSMPLNYKAIQNVHIKGGTWIKEGKGSSGSSFQFFHGSNITLEDMDIRTSSYQGHTMEIIACKNVTIRNCKITPVGGKSTSGMEEMIQIDLAAPSTAPKLLHTSKRLVNGATCKNVIIDKCTIKGAAAVCVNYGAADGGKWINHYHSNVKITDCNLTGTHAPAVHVSNCLDFTMTGCTLKSFLKKDIGTNFADGCNIYMRGKVPAAYGKMKYLIKNNKMYGSRHGMYLYFRPDGNKKAGKVEVSGNMFYSRKGKNQALNLSTPAKTVINTKNRNYKWNGK